MDCEDSCEESCWICLGAGDLPNQLERVCGCPRLVHRRCLARWSLQQAGKSEEKRCRFCSQELPSWKEPFLDLNKPHAAPIMSIHHGTLTHLVKVEPGVEGKKKFESEVRKLLHLDEDQIFDVFFECAVPGEADRNLELQSLSAYDAAVFCAAMTAADRANTKKEMEKSKFFETRAYMPGVTSNFNSATGGSQGSSPGNPSTRPIRNPGAAPEEQPTLGARNNRPMGPEMQPAHGARNSRAMGPEMQLTHGARNSRPMGPEIQPTHGARNSRPMGPEMQPTHGARNSRPMGPEMQPTHGARNSRPTGPEMQPIHVARSSRPTGPEMQPTQGARNSRPMGPEIQRTNGASERNMEEDFHEPDPRDRPDTGRKLTVVHGMLKRMRNLGRPSSA